MSCDDRLGPLICADDDGGEKTPSGQPVGVPVSSKTRKLVRFIAWVVVLGWSYVALASVWVLLADDDPQRALAVASPILGLFVSAVVVLSQTRTPGAQARR